MIRTDTVRLLLAGEFICPVAYAQDFDFLQDEENAASVRQVLEATGHRLARVGTEGAFFMAPLQLGPRDTERLREDFLKFRDVYGPQVRMLEFIRNGRDEFTCQMNEQVQLADLESEVNRNTTLENQLRSLIPLVRNAQARFSNREVLKCMLDHLERAGYLRLANQTTDTYVVTGKISHLHAVLSTMADHQPIASQDDAPGEDTGSVPDLFQADKAEPTDGQS